MVKELVLKANNKVNRKEKEKAKAKVDKKEKVKAKVKDKENRKAKAKVKHKAKAKEKVNKVRDNKVEKVNKKVKDKVVVSQIHDILNIIKHISITIFPCEWLFLFNKFLILYINYILSKVLIWPPIFILYTVYSSGLSLSL